MSRSIARVPVFVTAFLLSTAFALATLLFTVPAAHAVETTTFSQKLSSALCVRSPELTEQISAALADGIVSAKQEAFVDESRAGEFYFAQNGSGRCTITSVAMMVRRAAFLDRPRFRHSRWLVFLWRQMALRDGRLRNRHRRRRGQCGIASRAARAASRRHRRIRSRRSPRRLAH